MFDAPADPLPYGPNTRAVRRFLQRFAALPETDWTTAAAAFEAIEATRIFASADQALALAVERADRVRERDAVVGPLVQLVRGADSEPEHPVAAAALGAVLALVMRDVLDDGAFRTLYGPFATAIPLDPLFA